MAATKYLNMDGLITYDALIKSYVKNTLLRPTLISSATSTNNRFIFSNVSGEGLGVFTFGNCNTLINLYGLSVGITYKQTGTFVYTASGGVVTTTINIEKTSSSTIQIWSGNADFKIQNGFTGYLFLLKLY